MHTEELGEHRNKVTLTYQGFDLDVQRDRPLSLHRHQPSTLVDRIVNFNGQPISAWSFGPGIELKRKQKGRGPESSEIRWRLLVGMVQELEFQQADWWRHGVDRDFFVWTTQHF